MKQASKNSSLIKLTNLYWKGKVCGSQNSVTDLVIEASHNKAPGSTQILVCLNCSSIVQILGVGSECEWEGWRVERGRARRG